MTTANPAFHLQAVAETAFTDEWAYASCPYDIPISQVLPGITGPGLLQHDSRLMVNKVIEIGKRRGFRMSDMQAGHEELLKALRGKEVSMLTPPWMIVCCTRSMLMILVVAAVATRVHGHDRFWDAIGVSAREAYRTLLICKCSLAHILN
jgi:hypothetical protein